MRLWNNRQAVACANFESTTPAVDSPSLIDEVTASSLPFHHQKIPIRPVMGLLLEMLRLLDEFALIPKPRYAPG